MGSSDARCGAVNAQLLRRHRLPGAQSKLHDGCPGGLAHARVTPDLEQFDRGSGIEGREGAARRADDEVAGHVVGRYRPGRSALRALAAVGKLLDEQA